MQTESYGWLSSTPDLGSQGPVFESCYRRDSAHDCKMLHCIEPFIVTLPLSRYDLDNVESDIKLQTNIIVNQKQFLYFLIFP